MDSDKWTRDDYIVITTFWSPEFLHCFVEPWFRSHAEIFSDETKHSGIAFHDSFLFYTQYVFAIFVALRADLENHELQVSAGGMLIYLSIPLFGIFLRSWATAQLVLLRWGIAVHFVVKAVRFSAIFHQPPVRNGDNIRQTTAVNATVLAAVECIVHFVLRNDPRGLSFTVYTFIWFNLLLAISSVLASHWAIRRKVRIRQIQEDTIMKIIVGIKVDPRGKQYKYLQAERAHGPVALGMFLVILLMFSAVNVTEVIINNSFKLEDGKVVVSKGDQLIAAIVQLCTVPLIGVLFALFKSKCGLIAEGSLLALVYISIIVSLNYSIKYLEGPTVTGLEAYVNLAADHVVVPSRVTISVAFRSFALTCALVSFINFYWCESPIRLRTTTIATAFAVNDGLVALTNHLFPTVSTETAYWFVFINFIVGWAHVSLFIFYLFSYSKEEVDLDLKAAKPYEIPVESANPTLETRNLADHSDESPRRPTVSWWTWVTNYIW